MKFVQLYSNDPRFHTVRFNDGVNVVLGKVTRQYDTTTDSHNLGKSMLIVLLDFMLLKEVDAKHTFKKFAEFTDCIFFLEVLLNNGTYLTIRRSVKDASKVSFRCSEQSLNCLQTQLWDQKNLPLKKAKNFLNSQFSFDVLNRWDYRKTVSFFLRTQKDYNNVFQLGKFMNGKHKDWKPAVFELLGYDSENLIKKYDLEQQLQDIRTRKNDISDEMSVRSDDFDRLKSALQLKVEERDAIQTRVDSFNFYAEERNINRALVEDIESRISDLNGAEYRMTFELKKMKESLENLPEFDVEQLKELYGDVQIYFPDSIVHSYEDLLTFSRQVTMERNKYLRAQILQTEGDLKQVRSELESLNSERNIALSALQDKDSFHKFKEFQKRLAGLEGEIGRLTSQLENIDRLSSLSDKEEEIEGKISEVSKDIARQVKGQEGDMPTAIKRYFNEIFRRVFGVCALLYMKTNKAGNVEFEVEVAPDEGADATGEGDGNSYGRMLCVAFDIAVLAAYSHTSFFKFVYHDGVLEGLDNRKKELFMAVVRDFCNRYGIQYIFSSIEDDIPAPIMQSFSKQEICLALSDADDASKLFGFSF